MMDAAKEVRSELERSYLTVREERTKRVLRVQAAIARAIRCYLDGAGFVECLPPIIGEATDPGIRGARQASIDFYGREYKVMSSAILYKQMLASSLGRIYFFSPNIRLEPRESLATGRHLVEFFQVDIEEAERGYMDVMRTAERLVTHVLGEVREVCRGDLEALGRDLEVPETPFKRFRYDQVVDLLEKAGITMRYGEEIPWVAEGVLSRKVGEMFFIYDYPEGSRGFYDRVDPARPGVLLDFDLMYPEGYGEAVSGAEREHEYERVVERMLALGDDPSAYGWYMEMLKAGISPSSGFGIGVERLTRYICGLRNIWEARPYPKVAGIYSP